MPVSDTPLNVNRQTGTMANVCALALVVTATPSASGGGYYLARAQPDRPPGSSTSWPSRSLRRHVYAARRPHAATDKRCNEQLPGSLLVVSHPPARPCHPCVALCSAASLLTPTTPLPKATPTLPHPYSLSSSSLTPHPLAYANHMPSVFGARSIGLPRPCPVHRSPLAPPVVALRTPVPDWLPWHTHSRLLCCYPTPPGHALPSNPAVWPLVQHMHRGSACQPSECGEATAPNCPGGSGAVPGLGHVSPGLGLCRVRSYVAVSTSADGRPCRPGWANGNFLSRTAARMVTTVHAPSETPADLYHVLSFFIIPITDDGWAWRPGTPLGRTLSHTVERAATAAHVPSHPEEQVPPPELLLTILKLTN